MPLLKRPAATSPTLSLQGPLHVYPGSECGVCKKKLYTKFLDTPVQCTIVGSEVVEKAYLLRKECKEPFCVKTYRANFAYVDSVKVNTMSFRQMQDMKVYMVTHGFGFTMKYLQMFYYRLLRGNLAPGQESSVRAMVDGPLHDDLIGPRWFRHHLLRALEGYAIAQRSPDEVVPFPVDDPSSFFAPTSAPMTLDPPPPAASVSSVLMVISVYIATSTQNGEKHLERFDAEADPARSIPKNNVHARARTRPSKELP